MLLWLLKFYGLVIYQTVYFCSQNRDDIVSTGLALQRLTSDWAITGMRYSAKTAGTQDVFAGTDTQEVFAGTAIKQE